MKRVVITSAGIISSLGNSSDDITRNIKAGLTSFTKSSIASGIAVAPIEQFDLRAIAGQHKNFRYLMRGAQFGVAAAMLAARNDGFGGDRLDNRYSRAGIFTGCGPTFSFDHLLSSNDGSGEPAKQQALWMLSHLPNTQGSVISQLLGIHGENLTITTACSASLQAIGEAFRKIANGYLDIAFAGGGDSRISPFGLKAYLDAKALWKGEDVINGYAPFDEKRGGFVPGEGGAFFIIEELSHAQKRNAPIIAEIIGYGNSFDSYRMTDPDPEGIYSEQSVRHAICEAGLLPSDIDLVCAHGTGTILNDKTEAAMIHRSFSPKTKVTALKSWIGHLSSACGAVELGIILSCVQKNFIPRIRNLSSPCMNGVNFVMNSGEDDYSNILINNCGFGGQNASLAVRRWI